MLNEVHNCKYKVNILRVQRKSTISVFVCCYFSLWTESLDWAKD